MDVEGNREHSTGPCRNVGASMSLFFKAGNLKPLLNKFIKPIGDFYQIFKNLL